MAIDFNGFVQKSYSWTDWKSVTSAKTLAVQYYQDDVKYVVYGYDGPEVHNCIIWLNDVPHAIAETYSQDQNDADKSDFETNYKTSANKKIGCPKDSDNAD